MSPLDPEGQVEVTTPSGPGQSHCLERSVPLTQDSAQSRSGEELLFPLSQVDWMVVSDHWDPIPWLRGLREWRT